MVARLSGESTGLILHYLRFAPSLPQHPQKLRRGAFPQRSFARGGTFGREMGAEAELVDFGPGFRWAVG